MPNIFKHSSIIFFSLRVCTCLQITSFWGTLAENNCDIFLWQAATDIILAPEIHSETFYKHAESNGVPKCGCVSINFSPDLATGIALYI